MSKPPSRVEFLQGTLDVLILRTLMWDRTRPRHRQTHSEHFRRGSRWETGSVSRPAPLEAKGSHRRILEHSGEGQTRPLLSPFPLRAKTARRGTVEVAGFPRHGADLLSRRTGRSHDFVFRKPAGSHGGGRKKRSSARNSSSTWKRKRRSAMRRVSPGRRRAGPRGASLETSALSRRRRAPPGVGPGSNNCRIARHALRIMSANKAFSALAILSLALGVGANTAIYSFMDAVLLRRLPIPHPSRSWW